MIDQIKYEKLKDKKELNTVDDNNIDNSISEDKFDWDFILEREWSRTKQ